MNAANAKNLARRPGLWTLQFHRFHDFAPEVRPEWRIHARGA